MTNFALAISRGVDFLIKQLINGSFVLLVRIPVPPTAMIPKGNTNSEALFGISLNAQIGQSECHLVIKLFSFLSLCHIFDAL